jgi:hypothetical protein
MRIDTDVVCPTVALTAARSTDSNYAGDFMC